MLLKFCFTSLLSNTCELELMVVYKTDRNAVILLFIDCSLHMLSESLNSDLVASFPLDTCVCHFDFVSLSAKKSSHPLWCDELILPLLFLSLHLSLSDTLINLQSSNNSSNSSSSRLHHLLDLQVQCQILSEISLITPNNTNLSHNNNITTPLPLLSSRVLTNRGHQWPLASQGPESNHLHWAPWAPSPSLQWVSIDQVGS